MSLFFARGSWLAITTSLATAAGLAGCPSSHDVPPDAPATRDAPGSDVPLGTDGGPTALDAPSELDATIASDAPAPPDAPMADGGTLADAPSTASGDCDVDGDCPGGTCVELTPGGYRVCRTPPVEATSCGEPGIDECCTSAECTTGACYLGPVVRSCGGAARLPFNECASDLCADDSDCGTGQICAPAGTFAPIAYCVVGSCHHDADCTAEAGGRCVVARDPCCSIPTGLVCAYASDGCRTSADCTAGYCTNDGVRARCVDDGGPFCPL